MSWFVGGLLLVRRTFDQYNNVVLEACVERRIVGELYCDVDIGLCLIRGENIVMMGDIVRCRLHPTLHAARYRAVQYV